MAYIHMYQGNPTVALTDGTLISENTELNPISVTLNASNNEISSNIKLALRCDGANPPSAPNGYATTGNTVITPTGDSALKWALSLDGVTFGAYGDPLTITSVIDATNTIFYAKAKSTSDETPINDTSTDLVVTTTIGAV